MSDIKPKKLPPDFDPTAELWDRIIDDVATRGAPCFDTVEELVDQACRLDPRAASPGKTDSQKD